MTIKNGPQVSILIYAYAAAIGVTPVHAGTIPARTIALGFYANVLVSQVFESSFRDDGSDFDDSKVAAIVIGRTSQADVQQLLGRPGGEVMFPLVPKGKSAWTYTYSHFRNTQNLKKRTYRKAPIIRYDREGLVEEYELSISGEKL